MRHLAAISLLALASCLPDYTPSAPLGGRSIGVSIVDCAPLQRSLIAQQVESFGWHAADSGETTVRCADLGPTGGAGSYTLGSGEVLVDPAKAPGEAIRVAAGHEMVHQMLFRGPHPETAKLHICWFAFNESAPPGCHPTIVAKNALMSPAIGGAEAWNGDYETFGVAGQPEFRVTEADREFINTSLGLAP